MDIPEKPVVIVEHPLLNSLIMDKFLNYIQPTVTDLKRIRLVCKSWYEHTLSRWRKLAVISISPDAPLFSVKPVTSIGAYRFLQEFENPHSIYQFARKPFTNYKISGFTIDISACDNEPESKQFWDQIGPHMKYVHFQRCKLLDYDDGSSLVDLLVRKTPNIKELVLAFITSKSPVGPKNINIVSNLRPQALPHLKTLRFRGRVYIQKGLTQLLKCSPELDTIKSKDRIGYGCNFEDPILAIDSVSKTSPECLTNLKHLDFINSKALQLNSVWSHLSNSNIQLEFLTARLSPDPYQFGYRNSRSIEGFLISQRKFLKSLEVLRNLFHEPLDQFLEEFQMDGLIKLKLWGNVVNNFHFLKSTPNLQVLHVNTTCFEKWGELKQFAEVINNTGLRKFFRTLHSVKNMVEISNENFMQGVLLANLKVLHITFEFASQSWTQLGHWIPNVKELHTILNNSTVDVICRQWPNLTELCCLFGSKIDNSSVTGSKIDAEQKKAIVSLKNLEVFQLDALCNGSTLSDDAVVNGFLKMTALKRLQICVSSQMTTEAENRLKKYIPKCRIIRNYGTGHRVNYDCCQRTQFQDEVASGFK